MLLQACGRNPGCGVEGAHGTGCRCPLPPGPVVSEISMCQVPGTVLACAGLDNCSPSPGEPVEQEQEGILGLTWGRKKEGYRVGHIGARHRVRISLG